jgi:hypothetical protein
MEYRKGRNVANRNIAASGNANCCDKQKANESRGSRQESSEHIDHTQGNPGHSSDEQHAARRKCNSCDVSKVGGEESAQKSRLTVELSGAQADV